MFGTGGPDDLQLVEDYGSTKGGPACAFRLHSRICLPNTGVVQLVRQALYKNPPDINAAFNTVATYGDFVTNPILFKALQTAMYLAAPDGVNTPSKRNYSGAPGLRIVEEYADSSGNPVYWFEVEMLVDIKPSDYIFVQNDISNSDLPSAYSTLVAGLQNSRVNRTDLQKLLNAAAQS